MGCQGEKEVRFFFARLIATRERQNMGIFAGKPVGGGPFGWGETAISKELSLSHADVSYLYGKQILQSKIQVPTPTLKKFGIREKGKEMKRILYSKGDPIYPSFFFTILVHPIIF